jgi:hypothetical protein
MYTRYGNRCLPSLNGSGATQGSTNMLQVYLEWNAEDPVSPLEDQRNPYLENEYGSRNPFIDNPFLATIIWGGTPAEDRWNLFSVEDNLLANLEVYPNPASEVLWIQNSTIINNGSIIVYDLLGREVLQDSINTAKTSINTSTLTEGLYLVKVVSENNQIIKKVVIH